MNLLLISSLLAFQGTPEHAALHPADADLYLEVPDVPALVAAYEKAPLVQTFRQEEIRTLLSGLGVSTDVHPHAVVRDLLQVVVPEETSLGTLVDGIQSCSVSLRTAPAGEGDASALGLAFVVDFDSATNATKAMELTLASAASVGEAYALGGKHFTVDTAPGLPFWCATVEARYVLGAGGIDATGFAERLAAKGSGLEGNELYGIASSHLGEGSGATVCWIWQTRSPFEIIRSADELAGLLGGGLAATPFEEVPGYLDPFSGKRILRMQLRDDRFVTEIVSAGASGAALGGRPLEAAWTDPVPAGAMFLYSTAIDGGLLAPLVEAFLAELPGEGDANELSVQGVLETLGPGMSMCLFPIAGIGFPSTYFWVDLKDAEAFSIQTTTLFEKLGALHPGLSARTRDYKVKDAATGDRIPIPITTITLPQTLLDLGPMMSVTPAYAVLDEKLLVASNSMSVKRELKRMYGGEEEGAERNLLATHGFTPPADARSVFLMDWGLQIESLLGLARAFAGMAGEGMPFDPSQIPSGEVITRYMRPTYHYSRDVEGGTYRYHEASFGPETWLWIANAVFDSMGPATPPAAIHGEVPGEAQIGEDTSEGGG